MPPSTSNRRRSRYRSSRSGGRTSPNVPFPPAGIARRQIPSLYEVRENWSGRKYFAVDGVDHRGFHLRNNHRPVELAVAVPLHVGVNTRDNERYILRQDAPEPVLLSVVPKQSMLAYGLSLARFRVRVRVGRSA